MHRSGRSAAVNFRNHFWRPLGDGCRSVASQPAIAFKI
jgi:hypothetical protein